MLESTFKKNMSGNDIKMDGTDDVNDNLALKLFKDQCCESCSCKSEHEKTSPDITTS